MSIPQSRVEMFGVLHRRLLEHITAEILSDNQAVNQSNYLPNSQPPEHFVLPAWSTDYINEFCQTFITDCESDFDQLINQSNDPSSNQSNNREVEQLVNKSIKTRLNELDIAIKVIEQSNNQTINPTPKPRGKQQPINQSTDESIIESFNLLHSIPSHASRIERLAIKQAELDRLRSINQTINQSIDQADGELDMQAQFLNQTMERIDLTIDLFNSVTDTMADALAMKVDDP